MFGTLVSQTPMLIISGCHPNNKSFSFHVFETFSCKQALIVEANDISADEGIGIEMERTKYDANITTTTTMTMMMI
jgi:hypothetical protein